MSKPGDSDEQVAAGVLFLHAVAPAPGADDHFKLLAGEWHGTKITSQTGSCSIEGGDEGRDATGVMIDVDRLGAITATELRPDGTPTAVAWSGQVTPDGEVELELTIPAACAGKERDLTLKLHGAVKQGKKNTPLRLHGSYVPCIEYNCTFRITLSLRKESRGKGK